MSLGIIVNNDNESESTLNTKDSNAIAWVMARVNPWEEYRDTNYQDRWDEYYRLWRGIWASEDKSRQSENSKLITPALQQAIEATVAELEEATFGKGRWFDTYDDVKDEDKNDVKPFRDLLQEDLDDAGWRSAVSEVYLNSALYGTGIGKLVTKEKEINKVSTQSVDESNTVFEPTAEATQEIRVELVPISPYEFVIDPAAKSIDESLGCAHVFAMPKHQVIQNQADGKYEEGDVGSYSGDMKIFDDETRADKSSAADLVKIVEYHGLFPRSMIDIDLDEGEEVVNLGVNNQDGNELDIEIDSDTDLVESIVIIANDNKILRAVENQNFMKDRAFVAYQHDTVPNRFWGRGIAEKGYWPQKANDAEVRARIDAMALTIHPMMGVDATRLPRGANLSVQAGKSILTSGNPRDVLMPLNFGQVSNQTFHQSGELERMIQMGTGAMDSATPTSISGRNATASGMSMISSGAIKRAKRTMANIERHFLVPSVQKSAWRMMQFDPDRYKTEDVKFKVASTLGLMARELEQQQLTTLLQTTEPNGTGYWMLMKSIYENSSISNREEMMQIAQQRLEESLQPPQPNPMDEILVQEKKINMEAKKISLQIEASRAKTEARRVEIEAQKADSAETKDITASMLNIAKAEAEEMGTQMNLYSQKVDAITRAQAPVPAQSAENVNGTTGTGEAGIPA